MSGFDGLSGDNGDLRLISVLHEHWFSVFRGNAAWRSPLFFYPQKGTLSYSDTFLLNELFYAPLRLLGFDRYGALQWTFILLTAVGYFGLERALRELTVLPVWALRSLVLTVVFANAFAVKSGHPQMQFAYWLPWVFLLWRRRTRAQFAVASGFLFGLVIYSGYYVGFFALLLFALFVCSFVGVHLAFERSFPRLAAFVSAKQVAAFGLGLVMMLVPFFLTYGPVMKNADRYGYNVPMFFAARPGDMMNLGQGNVLWSGALRRLYGASKVRMDNGERSLATTPLMATLAVVTLVALVRCARRNGWSRAAPVAIALNLTYIVGRLATIRFGKGSFWLVPFRLVPGAKALRAIDRLQVVNLFVLAVAIAIGLGVVSSARGGQGRSALPLSIVGLLALVPLEQLNNTKTNTLDRSNELAFLAQVPDAPSSCESFYMTDASKGRPSYVVNTDAMVIASAKRLPTINGYSGQNPDNFAPDPRSEGYLQNIANWINAKKLSNVCVLERTTLSWSAHSPP